MTVVDFLGNGHVIPVDVSSCDVRFDLSFGSSNWSDYNKVYVHYSNHIPSISPGTHDDTNHHVKEVHVTEDNFNRKSITIPDVPVFHIGADNVVDDLSANTFEFQIYHLDSTFNVRNGNGKTVNVYGHMHTPSIINATEGNFSYTLEIEVPHYGDISNDIKGFVVTTGGPTWNTGLTAAQIKLYDYYGYNGSSNLSLNNYVLNTTFVDKSSFSYDVSANAGGEFKLDGSGNATFYLKVCDPSFAWVDISAGQLKREVINAPNTTLFTKYRIENSVRLMDTSNKIGLISNSVYASGNADPGALVGLTTITNHLNLSDISYTASGQGMNQTIHITGSAPLDMTLSNPYKARLFYTQSDISDSYTDSVTGNGVLNYVTDLSLSDDLSSDALMNDLSTNHAWSVVDIPLTSTHTLDYYLTDISDGVPVYMFVQMIEMDDLSVNKATPLRIMGDIKKGEPFAPPPKISNISASPHGTMHASENYVYQDSTDIHVDFSLNQYVPSEVGDINKIILNQGGTGTWTIMGDDINGEANYDYFGNSVSLSSDGSIVAIGALRHDGGKGVVRVFQWNNTTTTWDIMGGDIDGEFANEHSGQSVSLSSDGSIVAIGAHRHDGGKGVVRVFQWNNPTWDIMGDIDGESNYDYFGNSVSLSSDGSIVAIGAYLHDGGKGHVRVFQWNNTTTTWDIMGDDINGEAYYDYFGNSVSLSSDGSIVAIGALNHDGARGHVRVFQWNNTTTTWDIMGGDINGEDSGDWYGRSVSLSSDGSIVAIGAQYHDGARGHVRVFQWNNTTWDIMGGDINGVDSGDWSGYSVSLSSDGSIVAIGAIKHDGAIGHVRVFQWNNTTWDIMGGDINGEDAGDHSGYSVSLSSDGSIVAIGAVYNDGNGSDSAGHVRVYEVGGVGPIEIDVSGNVEDLSTKTMLTGPFNLAPHSDQSYRLHISNSDISLTEGTDIELSLLFATDYYNNTDYTTTNDYYSSSVDISVVDKPDQLDGVTFTAKDGSGNQVKGYVHIEVPADTATNTWDEYLNNLLYYNGNATMHNLSVNPNTFTLDDAKAHAITNNYEAFRSMGDSIQFFEAGSYVNYNTYSNIYDSYILSSTTTPLSGTDGMGNNYSGLTEIPVTLFIEPAMSASNVFVNAYTDLINVDRSTIEHPMADVIQPLSSQANLVYDTLLTRPDTTSNFELDVYSPLDVVDFSYSIAARNDKYTLSRNSGNNQHTYESDDSDIADLMGDLNWSSKTQLVTKHGFTNTLTAVNGPFVGQPNNNDATITLTFHETEDGFYGRGDFSNNCVVVLEDRNGTSVPVKGTGLTEANKPTQVAPLIVTYDVSGINGGDISGGHTFRYYLKNTVDGITGPDASGTFYTRGATNPPNVQFLSGTSPDDSLSITPTTVNFIRITMPDLSGGANYGGDASFNDDKSDYTLHVELLKDSTVQVQSHVITGAVSDQTYFDFSDNTIGIPDAGASFDMRLRELEPNTLYTVKSYIENITIISPETKSSSNISSIDISATDKTIEDNSGSFATTTLSGAIVKSDNRFSPALDLEHVDLSWTAVSPQHDSGVEGYAVIATISGEDYTVWSGTDTDVSFHSGHKFFQTNTPTLLSSDISSSHNQSLDTLATSFNLTEIKTPIYGLPIEYRVRTIFKDQDNVSYTGGASYNDQIDSNKTTALTPKTRPTIESLTVKYDAAGEYIEGFDISLSTGGDLLDKVLVLVTGENMTPVVHQASDLSYIPVSGFHSHVLTPLQDISFAGTGADEDNDSIIMINSPQGGNLYYLNDLKTGITISTTSTNIKQYDLPDPSHNMIHLNAP